jgi:hypothetical protein
MPPSPDYSERQLPFRIRKEDLRVTLGGGQNAGDAA